MEPSRKLGIEDPEHPLEPFVRQTRATARRLVVVREIAKETGIHHLLLSEWIYEGRLPRPIIVGRAGRSGEKRRPGRPIAMGYLAGDEVEQVKAMVADLARERLRRMEGFA